MNRWIKVVGLCWIILLLFWFSSAIYADSPDKAPRKIPRLTMKDLSGKDVSLKDFRGKVVLVNIWATWCGPCRNEIPDLIKLRDKYLDKGFEVLGIVMNSREKDVQAMVKEFKIDYPVLWGTIELFKEFGSITAIPRTFILNTEGQIVEDVTGSHNFEYFEELIKKYLNE